MALDAPIVPTTKLIYAVAVPAYSTVNEQVIEEEATP